MIKNKMINYFGIVTDQRQKAKIRYRLTDILFICVVGTLANCDSWVDIEDFVNTRIDFFKKILLCYMGYLLMILFKEFLNGLIQKNFKIVL